jgi:arylsulfatase A-like enzyme
MRRVIKFGASFALSILGIGFFWGAAEALFNHYIPAVGVPRAFYLLESVNDRTLFYVLLAFVVITVSAVVSAAVRFVSGQKGDTEELLTLPLILGIALAVTSNLYWSVLSYGRFVRVLDRLGKTILTPDGWRLILVSAILNGVGILIFYAFIKTRKPGRTKRALYYAGAAGTVIFFTLQGIGAYKTANRPVPPHLPDVYVISVDACRADYFDAKTAPRVNAYATENCIVFENARAPTSWTTPSFASMFTGQYPDACARGGFALVRTVPTLAEILYRNGYDTYLVTGNPALTPARGLPRGFRYFYYWEMSPLLLKSDFYETNLSYALFNGYNIKTEPGEINGVVSERAKAVISTNSARPKFLWVHYLDPHSPYYPEADFVPENYRKLAEDPGFCLSDDIYKPENVPALKELYRGEIRMLDDEIMNLVELVESSGDPVIVFTSDHGEEFYEHGKFKHGKSVYEEVLAVPLFFKLPAGTPGVNGPAASDRGVNAAAIAPTLLEILGYDVPASMQVGSLFSDRVNSPAITFFGSKMHTGGRIYGALEGERKFVVKAGELDKGGEYYDLATDPGERNPLPFDDTAEKMRKALKDWVETNGRLRKMQETGRTEKISMDDFRALGYVK